jgi:hypothetical protein
MPDVLSMGRPGITPVFLDLRRQSLDAGQLFPILSAVLTPVKMDRLYACVDNPLVGGIHGNRPDVPFEYPPPILSRIVGTVETILSDA